jgi:FkbM family methyltransferase
MKKVFSYWLPDDEDHFSSFINRYAKWGEPPEYQYQVRNKAMTFVDKFDVSVDIGANLGLWSQSLEQKFLQNYGIEPIQEFSQFLNLNAPRTRVIYTALGSSPGSLNMTRDQHNYGKNQICDTGNITVSIQKLDDLDLPPADFIKIDVEGFEYEVLKGGEQYIKSSYPVLVVEQEQKKSVSTQLLLSWGYSVVDSFKHDYIYKRL